jgi:large subunit ribosomal protein L21
MTFAVITTGGKQYKVAVGDVLSVEKLEAEGSITFDKVLLVDDGSSTKVGTPFVAGAQVTADIVEHGKGPKIYVVRYMPKSRWAKKNGHRQPFTKIKITGIK